MLNDYYKKVVSEATNFAMKKTDGDYYPMFKQKVKNRWVTVESGSVQSDDLPFCCGVYNVGYLCIPSTFRTMDEALRDECVAVQISVALKNTNFLIYTAVLGNPPDDDADEIFSEGEIRDYELIVESLKRLGFEEFGPKFPNKNTGCLIQVLGAARAADDMLYHYEKPWNDDGAFD